MNDVGLVPSLPPTLLLGASGQLGLALCQQLLGKEGLWLPGRAEVDLLNLRQLVDRVERLRPRVIINAAAYTQVDQAESEQELAYKVNAQAVAALAEAARRVGALLVHFSTDYVFDGHGGRPWREEDTPKPLNAYGLSKWQGEQAILGSGCSYLILRTSWLHSPYRYNFVKNMLCLGQTQSELSVVCDQIGAPTSASMLVDMTLLAIERILSDSSLAGLYHVTASGEVCWFDYACFVFDEAHKMGLIDRVPRLMPVASEHYPTQVRRPLNSRLDTTRFCNAFGVQLPDWQDGVRNTLMQLKEGE